MTYSFFLKERCQSCGGNVICYTSHVPDVLAELRTFECMMCCREYHPAQLVSFKKHEVVATEKPLNDVTRRISAWEPSSPYSLVPDVLR
jgi:hypothetical protein